MNRRRLGWLAVLGGGALALTAQVAGPVGVPLYDGVVVQEPYRFLQPTGDQEGDPTSFQGAPALTGDESPTIIAATTESPPQAQLIAQVGAFAVPAGTTALRVAVEAVEPPLIPPPAPIVGNVYRFTVTTASGAPLTIKPCEGCASLVLRAPEGTGAASVARFAGGTWTLVPTNHAGMVATYATNPTALGDYAVLATEPVVDGGFDPTLLIPVAAFGLIGLAAVGLFLLRVRPRQTPAAPPTPRRGGRSVPDRVPSKRRRPRPPSEGS